MNHSRGRYVLWRGNAGLQLSLALATLLFGGELQAQLSESFTNLAQITRALSQKNQVVADLNLEGTVFTCNTNTGVVVLEDRSGACLLELDGFNQELSPGDNVKMQGKAFLLCRGVIGAFVSRAPFLDNDGTHAAVTVSREYSLNEGRYPVRVDWFNQMRARDLGVSCVPVSPGTASNAVTSTNLIHGLRAECYQGFWYKLPNFQLLQPVKVGSITNFDLGFRVRDESVGIRFEGYVDIPKPGEYHFDLRSDDGARLWVGSPEVAVTKTGSTAPPSAPQASIGEPVANLDAGRLATIEGRVTLVSRWGKGFRLELRSEHSSALVSVADGGALDPADLLNACIRARGVAGGVMTEKNQRIVLGTLAVASYKDLIVIEDPPGKGAVPSVLKSIVQVHSLSNQAAERKLPVIIRGTVTASSSSLDHWMVLQDETRGTFVDLISVSQCEPNVGELWEIVGHTQPGGFAPIIMAEKATLLGKGQFPEPAYPTWGQLANGSMDVQWVELRGLVTGVQTNRISLLLPEGRQTLTLMAWGGAELAEFDKAVVRIRGTLFTSWDQKTHEARPGTGQMYAAAITVETPAPSDPFNAPEKTPRGLFQFDAKAMPLQRVKVHGQVTYVGSTCLFVEQGAGIEIHPRQDVAVRAGDLVEAVGYPGISAAGPQLLEALLRTTEKGALPQAPRILPTELPNDKFASTRIRVEGQLVGSHAEGDALVLQIQTRQHLFPAHIANGKQLISLRTGSRLSLTGIYVPSVRGGISPGEGPSFKLLIDSPASVAVLSAPSWWTLQRLLTAVGVLIITLALAAVWITLLRRQVTQRTSRLHEEIRERERVERQRALEAERSRIARDLHDELGTGLTEMSLLAAVGYSNSQSPQETRECVRTIADKARTLVSALDVIVWAIDPSRNSLQSLADYIGSYAMEFFAASKIVCRLNIPIECAPVTLTGAARHSLFLAVKETLNNVIRHAAATEVELQISQQDNAFEIVIADNGRGFDPKANQSGHGLSNLRHRAESLDGQCLIESQPGKGTRVKFTIPLPLDNK